MPGAVSLIGQGFEMVETEAIVASFARHLMAGFDQWNEQGFGPIAFNYLARLLRHKAGERRGLDRNRELLVGAPLDKRPPIPTGLVLPLQRSARHYPILRRPRHPCNRHEQTSAP